MTQLKALGGLSLEPIPFTQPKPLLLLCYLSLEGSQPRRHLAELFWPGGNRMKSLSMALSRLRQGAGDVVVADERHARATLRSDAQTLLECLDKSDWQKAHELYTGAFLEGLTLDDWSNELAEWVYTTREYLAERVQYALLNLAEAAAKQQDFVKAREFAERAYKLPGLGGTEITGLKRLYTLLCAGSSMFAPEVRRELGDYNISVQLNRDEAKAMFQVNPAQQADRIAQPFPTRQTSFVGRDLELTELTRTLQKVQLLTLQGTGGVGKTRLALQLAHEQQKQNTFEHVFFIPLETLTSADLILPTMLSTLGLTQQSTTEPLTQLVDFILQRSVLLVLDNFDHLVGKIHSLSELLQKCPNLKILVTSRERLNLEEEHLFPLEGLNFPTGNTTFEAAKTSDAVVLFNQRAQQLYPQFELKTSLGSVLKICELVEGLPLGLELAAGWTRLMSCQEIADEIERGLEFLTTTTRNVPERHRSLRALFEYSWRSLTPKEQEVLPKLSVFSGGFRRDAASKVAGATIPVLASLVDKSLLRVVESRYSFHPLLQQYAREKLDARADEANDVLARHAEFFVDLVKAAAPELRGNQQQQWLTRLTEEYDNVRNVLDWTLKDNVRNTLGLQCATSLYRFWYSRGYIREGRKWLDLLLGQDVAPGIVYLEALHINAELALLQGEYGVTQAAYETCIRLGQAPETQGIVASALGGLGHMAYERGDYSAAHDFYHQSLDIERNLKNAQGISACLNNLGIVAYAQADYPAARTFYEESLAIDRELGDNSGIALTLGNIGLIALEQGDAASARVCFDEVFAIRKALEDKTGLAIIYGYMALLEEAQEKYEIARELATEGLKLVVEINYRWGGLKILKSLASLAVHQKEYEHAAVFGGALESLSETLGSPMRAVDKVAYQQTLERARVQLGGEVFTQVWEKGRLMELAQVLELVSRDEALS